MLKYVSPSANNLVKAYVIFNKQHIDELKWYFCLKSWLEGLYLHWHTHV